MKWRFSVHLIIVAHPTKLQRKQDGSLPVPSLYDISDSANWANKADVGVIIHREGDSGTQVRIAKSRYHDTVGKPGEVKMAFSFYTGRFEAAA